MNRKGRPPIAKKRRKMGRPPKFEYELKGRNNCKSIEEVIIDTMETYRHANNLTYTDMRLFIGMGRSGYIQCVKHMKPPSTRFLIEFSRKTNLSMDYICGFKVRHFFRLGDESTEIWKLTDADSKR